jgi:hypothetical protein
VDLPQKALSIPASSYMGLDLAGLLQEMSALIEPLRLNPGLALCPYRELTPPLLRVAGFEPLLCGEQELRVLGRHEAKNDEG